MGIFNKLRILQKTYLQIRRENIQRYLEAHKPWPELMRAMKDSGIKVCYAFMRKDGLIVVYLEADDPQASLDRIRQTEVNKRWQGYMSQFFDGTSPDMQGELVEHLEQYFCLE